MSKNLQNLLTKEMLEYEYNFLKSMQKVADKLQISVDSVYKYMKLYDIPYEKHYQAIYKCDEMIFNTDTEKSFYLAGFIAADGSLQKRKYSKILKIGLSTNDLAHLEKIKNILNSTHPIKIYDVKPNKLVTTKHKCAELQIANNNLFDDLARFNIIPNKTFIYKMPEWIINHPLVNHFIRGYFDGDGTITYCGLGKGRTVKQMACSILGTETFINQYRDILVSKCNINKAKIMKHYSVYKISYSGNNVVSRIRDFIYKGATIYLDRKRDKFLITG